MAAPRTNKGVASWVSDPWSNRPLRENKAHVQQFFAGQQVGHFCQHFYISFSLKIIVRPYFASCYITHFYFLWCHWPYSIGFNLNNIYLLSTLSKSLLKVSIHHNRHFVFINPLFLPHLVLCTGRPTVSVGFCSGGLLITPIVCKSEMRLWAEDALCPTAAGKSTLPVSQTLVCMEGLVCKLAILTLGRTCRSLCLWQIHAHFP